MLTLHPSCCLGSEVFLEGGEGGGREEGKHRASSFTIDEAGGPFTIFFYVVRIYAGGSFPLVTGEGGEGLSAQGGTPRSWPKGLDNTPAPPGSFHTHLTQKRAGKILSS